MKKIPFNRQEHGDLAFRKFSSAIDCATNRSTASGKRHQVCLKRAPLFLHGRMWVVQEIR